MTKRDAAGRNNGTERERTSESDARLLPVDVGPVYSRALNV